MPTATKCQLREISSITAVSIFCTNIACVIILFSGCSTKDSQPIPSNSPRLSTPIARSFAYPVGVGKSVTEEKDGSDNWYNAQDFGENNHLGEDWNKNTGRNTDCGEPVYSAANGKITYAQHAGSGWGNVVIVEHRLPDNSKVQTLYGHLETIVRKKGIAKKREKIGTIGNADGKYLCHLHFELRDERCPMWNRVFIGYSPMRKGWLDPSDFIDRHR